LFALPPPQSAACSREPGAWSTLRSPVSEAPSVAAACRVLQWRGALQPRGPSNPSLDLGVRLERAPGWRSWRALATPSRPMGPRAFPIGHPSVRDVHISVVAGAQVVRGD